MFDNFNRGGLEPLPHVNPPAGIPAGGIEIGEPVSPQLRAEKAIERIRISLGDAAGAPAGDLIGIRNGYYRQFAHGRIYINSDDWNSFWVYGWIGDRYAQLDGPDGWLGWPVSASDEIEFDGGKVRIFQNGSIYWWPDTGALDLNNVVVHYTGLHCFGETDIDVGSSDDEPYATIGVAGPDGTTGTFRSKIYDGVDAGEGRFEVIEIYHGKPSGIIISTILQEHSGGDTESSRALIKEAVEKGGTALAATATLIPGVGFVLGPLATAAHQFLKKDIIDALNSFVENTLGFADRPLGTDFIELTPKQMVILATRPEGHAQFGEIPWRFETHLLTRFGASYKVYFNIFPG